MIDSILYNDFVENKDIVKREILEYDNNELEKIIKFNPDYKYMEASNSNIGIMLSREEIFKLISNKYLYIQLPFKYKIKYDFSKILYYKKIKKQNL